MIVVENSLFPVRAEHVKTQPFVLIDVMLFIKFLLKVGNGFVAELVIPREAELSLSYFTTLERIAIRLHAYVRLSWRGTLTASERVWPNALTPPNCYLYRRTPWLSAGVTQ